MMSQQMEQKVSRARQRVASSDRRQGYRVSVPPGPDALPPFLHDCDPTLVAEREDDHVVAENKPTEALKGVTDLIELAERVAGQPGWRLELITLGRQASQPQPREIGWLEGKIALGDDVSVCFYRAALLEMLIRSLALVEGIRVKHKSGRDLVHELAFEGTTDAELTDRLRDALQWQTAFLHDGTNTRSAAEQAAELDRLCHAISALQRNSED